ncbi:MAG TPA: hypothetical protein PKN80_09240, partial [bacterium]|nr:hypothetical protein [bacterium]
MSGRIPVDGVVTEGDSSVNESMVTGESIPVEKTAGSQVIGGTINLSGAFRFRAVRVGRETFLAQVIRLDDEDRRITLSLKSAEGSEVRSEMKYDPEAQKARP